MNKEPIYLWEITVAGYGTFMYTGTEAQAEEMRKHKARWEQGVAKKVILKKVDKNVTKI